MEDKMLRVLEPYETELLAAVERLEDAIRKYRARFLRESCPECQDDEDDNGVDKKPAT